MDISLDFEKASYKWMLNKYKTTSKTYKYYCKYPKCVGYRMLYPKNNINYKLHIYSNYCTKHTNKSCNYNYINKKTKINTNPTTNPTTNSTTNTNITEYNQLDEINIDEINK